MKLELKRGRLFGFQIVTKNDERTAVRRFGRGLDEYDVAPKVTEPPAVGIRGVTDEIIYWALVVAALRAWAKESPRRRPESSPAARRSSWTVARRRLHQK